MNEIKSSQGSCGDLAELRSCSATEALRRDAVTLELGDEETLLLSPLRRAHHRYFARVKLNRFTDLQVLGLVPRRIKEQVVRAAVVADDEQALRLAEDRLRLYRGPSVARCGCQPTGEAPAPSLAEELAVVYREVRRDYHPALSRVLSEHYGIEIAWNSTLAGSVKGWTAKLSREALVLLGVFQDITIGRRAVLEFDRASRELLARSIRIHREGKLVHRGAYLRIWANSIETYIDIATTTAALNPQAPIWALER